jgi:hypothetical protein
MGGGEFISLYTQIRLFRSLTLNVLTTTIVAPPSSASKWQMGFNSAFKGLICWLLAWLLSYFPQ